ncbi:MAG: NusG domain II-containing protein [Spirochaetaceae bacterium]|nr:NusG domain II-containing protein [Spirochaetaceae bacterium]
MNHKFFFYLCSGDYVVFGIALAFFAGSLYLVYGRPAEDVFVRIEGKDGVWVYPLNSIACLNVSGPLGETAVQLTGKAVMVVSSPCKNQTCIKQGSASTHGQWIVCLPNQILVTIEGSPGNGRDISKTKVKPDAGTW